MSVPEPVETVPPVVFESPVAPFVEGELIPPVDVFPTPLPLDPLPTVQVLAETGADVWSWPLAACLLLAVGGLAWWFGREVES